MQSDEQQIEEKIQAKGLTAPRMTPEMIDGLIDWDIGIHYHVFNGGFTVAALTLKNGYTVTGESAAASPENYNKEIGEEIAFANARNKIWGLAGYNLKQTLYDFQDQADISSPAGLCNTAAQLAHEVNRVWCAMTGDLSQPSWQDAPDWQKQSALNGVQFHLDNPEAGDSSSHVSWMSEKLADGWVYGEVKDPEKKTHPCMVPFTRLPMEQQIKDALFRSIVHAIVG